MPTQKDIIREELAAINERAMSLGVNVADIQKEVRGESGVAASVLTMIGTSTPRVSRFRLAVEMPPEGTPPGAFDGTNQDFPIRGPVLGLNIAVLHVVQADGSVVQLTRTTSPAPAAGSFYFDGGTIVRVGTAPAASDMLAAVYVIGGQLE